MSTLIKNHQLLEVLQFAVGTNMKGEVTEGDDLKYQFVGRNHSSFFTSLLVAQPIQSYTPGKGKVVPHNVI